MNLSSLKKFIVLLVVAAFVAFSETVLHNGFLVLVGIAVFVLLLIIFFALRKIFPPIEADDVEPTVDLSDRSLIGKHYSLESEQHYICDVQKLIIKEETLKMFDEQESSDYSFYAMIPLEEKTPHISIYEGEKLSVQYILENKENEDFSDKILCLRGYFICRNGVARLMSEGVVVQSRDVDINMAFKSLDTIIYRFENHFLNADNQKVKEVIAKIDGADLQTKGLRYGNHITPANVRCIGVCRKCGKPFVFSTFNYPMADAEPVYSDDGQFTAKLHTPPTDKRNWRITLGGITYRYYNSFCCPYCKGAYIDYKNHNEMKKAGNLGCVHFGKQDSDITALSELYNEYKY